MPFTPAQVALLDENSDVIEAVRLLRIEFKSVTYHLAESVTDLTTTDGQVWQAAPGWIKSQPIERSEAFDAAPALYTVNDLNGSLIQSVLHDEAEWMDAPVTQALQLYLDRAPVGPYIVLHRGKIADIEVEQDVATQRANIRAETLFGARNFTPLGQYTDRDQQARSAGDLGCELVPTFENKTIKGFIRG